MRLLPHLIAGLILAVGSAALADEPTVAPPAPAAAPAVYKPTSLRPAPGVPRTAEGHPDLQGVVWDAYFFAPLQLTQVKLAPGLVLPEADARKAHRALVSSFLDSPIFKPILALDPEFEGILNDSKGFPIVRGERRSRLLVLPADGKLPLTPEGKKQSQISMSAMVDKADNPEDRNSLERCLANDAAPPDFFLGAPNPRQFVQTRDYVVIHSETGDEVRIIPFATAHGAVGAATAYGDAIAHWDGDTLVVETTNSPAGQRKRFSPLGALVVNPKARVIERFTRVSRDELLYQFTVEDPEVYAAPWLAEYSFFRAPFRMFPGECHEGNYSLPNILAGARVEERAKAAQAAADPARAAK
jgi:hypothetical protein